MMNGIYGLNLLSNPTPMIFQVVMSDAFTIHYVDDTTILLPGNNLRILPI